MLNLNGTQYFDVFNIFILFNSRQKVLWTIMDLSGSDKDKMFRQIK